MIKQKILSMVGWGWFVNWGWSMVSWGLVDWFVGIVTWSSFVSYFYNISRVSISSVVLDNLGTAIREGNTVFTISGITITSFICAKVDSSIFVSNSVFVLVFSWDVSVSWFFVSWSMVSWGMVSWSWLVHWCWFVGWGWFVNWGWVVWSSMMDWGVSVCWGVDWDVSWGVDSSAVLFSSIRIVYVLWSSMGLASNDSMVGSMRFVDGMAYGWGIAVFDYLMARLISQGNGEKRSDCNKSL